MDLFCPTKSTSLGGRIYAFVVVYDYSRFTWMLILSSKDKAVVDLLNFSTKFKMKKKGVTISKITSDHGGEFENKELELF